MAKIHKRSNSETSVQIFLSIVEHKEVFEALSDKQAGQLIKYIFRYLEGGVEPIDDPVVKSSFHKMKADLLESIRIAE